MLILACSCISLTVVNSGTNFYIPTKMPASVRMMVDFGHAAVPFASVSVMQAERGAKFKFIIADACRSRLGYDAGVHAAVKGSYDPQPKLSFAALQQSNLAKNTYVVCSSGEATVSYAGTEDSMGHFTAELVPLITKPDLELLQLGKELGKAVGKKDFPGGKKMICEKIDKMEDDFRAFERDRARALEACIHLLQLIASHSIHARAIRHLVEFILVSYCRLSNGRARSI